MHLVFSAWRRAFDAGATFLGVKFVEEPRELLQHGIPATLDGAQRMVGGHALVEVNAGQEVRLGLRFSTGVSLTHRFQFCSIHERFLNNLLAFIMAAPEAGRELKIMAAMPIFGFEAGNDEILDPIGQRQVSDRPVVRHDVSHLSRPPSSIYCSIHDRLFV